MVKNNENSRTYLKNITLPLPPCPATKKIILFYFFIQIFFAQKIGPYLDDHARGGLFNEAHYGATVFLDRLHRHPTLANQQSVVLSL
jgi:hypothetical protein